ncbi:MAG: glycosyltransferase, partial [Candidatus Sericytochromatia bacterium]|nr:glycosyltransferase [Candidatus Tanganyikabacteria bacterium]
MGGDTVQMLATKAALEAQGVQVELSLSAVPSAEDCDLAHIFNLQFAQLALDQVQALAARGVPTVMSPIFWDHAELEWATEELREIFTQPIEKRSGLLQDFAKRALAARHDAGGGRSPGERLAALREAQRKAASWVDMLLPNSSAEVAALIRTPGPAIAPCRVVPNAVDAGRFGKTDANAFVARYGMRDFVLAAARWDPRKNLLLLCSALQGTGIPLVLIGQRPNAEYEARVRAMLPPGSLTIDHLPPADLAAAYAAARVHAMPSWFETPGLSSMEAAMAGCAIVVGDRAAEREYFGEAAYYCDPADVSSIRQAVLAAARGDYIALLKGDTVVSEGWLTYLLRHLGDNPQAGLVGPRANAGPGNQAIPGLPYDSLPEMHDHARTLARLHPGEAAPSPVAGTFAAVLHRATLERVGAFDPAFPSGTLAAVDCCVRIHLAGMQVVVAEDVFVHHSRGFGQLHDRPDGARIGRTAQTERHRG